MAGRGFTIGLKEFKAGFFNRNIVADSVETGIYTANNHAGNYVKKSARRLMKPSKRFTDFQQLSKPAKRDFLIRKFLWHHFGEDPKYKPKLPLRPSMKGKPPRYNLQRTKMNIKRAILAAEQVNFGRPNTAVVGPWKFKGTQGTPVPQVHEKGGTLPAKNHWSTARTYPKRPYMIVALIRTRIQVGRIYRNHIKTAMRNARGVRREAFARARAA